MLLTFPYLAELKTVTVFPVSSSAVRVGTAGIRRSELDRIADFRVGAVAFERSWREYDPHE